MSPNALRKLCDMPDVVELGEEMATELWQDDESKRVVLRAYNEGGFNSTDVDLFSLLEWLTQDHWAKSLLDNSGYVITTRQHN